MLPTILLVFVVLLMGIFIILSFLHKNGDQPKSEQVLSTEDIEKMKKKTKSM